MLFPESFIKDLLDAGFSEKETIEIITHKVWDMPEPITMKMKYISIREAKKAPELKLPQGKCESSVPANYRFCYGRDCDEDHCRCHDDN